MAIFAMDQSSPYDLGCDGTADVQNLPAYAESNRLKPGASCYVIDTGDLYMMRSDKVWKKQG